ncbi:glucosamine-6-phosphate deaminase [Chitinophaga sp. SYP-B3965]|uniref:6-phosphogluconolactonase n=1 Tax=Chitinophaga sp. SYP-B3965 TaxID=2663120 RepID=UPI001299F713|nr:6-phosphogluconolactonase [Chitinophaga sp. SYP-B3965]MRG48346.1 glucosamine-6-phosphate deaminase [Chitinophaga sp. SYP-B3965]
MIRKFKKDKLEVRLYEDRATSGKDAARCAVEKVQELLAVQPEVNIIFAAAPSQNEFLEAFSKAPLEWERINAFHMDEYIGLETGAAERFGSFLYKAIFGKVPFRSVHYLNGNEEDVTRYAALLAQYPTDIVCMGIGENAHIAFNDPPVADFNDPYKVKVVELDEVCRVQQVNDKCFDTLEDVPTHAITLTIPALMAARFVYCIVPGPTKAVAVYNTLNGVIRESVPATALREHENAILFIDQKSGSML